MDCYPSNTAAQYTTKLPHALSLEGDWEVALTEISVPDMFHNVKKDSCFLTLTEAFSTRYTIPIEEGYYESIDELAKYLSDMLGYRGISFTMVGQKVKMSIKGELIVNFNIYLAKKLGFNHLMGYSQGDHHAQYPSNMSQETVPTLFVYCDVLEHVVVGDVMAPLLRIVDMSRKKSYGRMHQVLNPPLLTPKRWKTPPRKIPYVV